MIVVKLLLFWMLMAVCAMLNGILREKVLGPHFGAKVSLPLSGLSLSAIVFIVSYIAIDFLGRETRGVYVCIGIFWVLLTLLFEYGYGRFVGGRTWSQINAVFNLRQGNLFIVVLVVTLFAPLLSAYLKGYL